MFCNIEHYKRMFNICKETWAKPILDNEYSNFQYWGYTASYDNLAHINQKEHIIYVPCDDSRKGTYIKTYLALYIIKTHPEIFGEFDYIFRTNVSTFINLELLNMLINNIKDEKEIYCGHIYIRQGKGEYNLPKDFYALLVGHSILFNKLYIELLNNKLNGPDDGIISYIFNKHWYKENKCPIDYYKMFGAFEYKGENIENVLQYIASKVTIYNGDKNDEEQLMFDLNDYYNENKEKITFNNVENILNKHEYILWVLIQNFVYSNSKTEIMIPITYEQTKMLL